MTKIAENTSNRMVLQSGSTTMVLDKGANKAEMRRKLLFWNLSPQQMPLSEVGDVTVDAAVDRASGVEVCNTMLVTKTGAAWALPAADKADAERTRTAVKEFLGLR